MVRAILLANATGNIERSPRKQALQRVAHLLRICEHGAGAANEQSAQVHVAALMMPSNLARPWRRQTVLLRRPPIHDGIAVYA